MKRILLGTLFAAASFNAFADAPSGAGCGWGNMLFKGQRGVATHVVAATTNGTSGNNTFGMTTGTNGCHTNGALSYGGKPLLVLGSMMDELSEDMAKGNGWIALGHYERGKLGGWRSYVDDERFFLADNGESHPDADWRPR